MRLGPLIRSHRKRKAITVAAFAKHVNISPGHLSRIESNDRLRKPSARVLKSIATALELDVDVLFCAAGKVPVDVARWIVSTPGVLTRLRREMVAA